MVLCNCAIKKKCVWHFSGCIVFNCHFSLIQLCICRIITIHYFGLVLIRFHAWIYTTPSRCLCCGCFFCIYGDTRVRPEYLSLMFDIWCKLPWYMLVIRLVPLKLCVLSLYIFYISWNWRFNAFLLPEFNAYTCPIFLPYIFINNMLETSMFNETVIASSGSWRIES